MKTRYEVLTPTGIEEIESDRAEEPCRVAYEYAHQQLENGNCILKSKHPILVTVREIREGLPKNRWEYCIVRCVPYGLASATLEAFFKSAFEKGFEQLVYPDYVLKELQENFEKTYKERKDQGEP